MPDEKEIAQWYTAGGYVDPELHARLKRFALAWQFGGLVSWNKLPENAKAEVRARYHEITKN